MGGCPNVSCPRIMNDKDIIDKDCWAGWWLVGATHADEYHDQVYHDHLSLPLPLILGGSAQCPHGQTHY